MEPHEASPSDRRHQRMQAILEQTKRLFIRDAELRVAEADEAAARWRAGQMDSPAMADILYRCAHTLKGVAQTVGCDGIDRLSRQAVHFSIQHTDTWDEASLQTFLEMIDQLRAEVKRESGLLP